VLRKKSVSKSKFEIPGFIEVSGRGAEKVWRGRGKGGVVTRGTYVCPLWNLRLEIRTSPQQGKKINPRD